MLTAPINWAIKLTVHNGARSEKKHLALHIARPEHSTHQRGHYAALLKYVQATGDELFLERCGAGMLVEIGASLSDLGFLGCKEREILPSMPSPSLMGNAS